MTKKSSYLPAYVLRSNYRREVFFELSDNPASTQSYLLKKTSPKYRSHLSRSIKELLEYGLIECINPEDKTYKMYNLSKKGLEVKEEISKIYKQS